MSKWFQSIAVYVTRQSANGETGTYSVPAILAIGFVFIFELNFLLWGTVGIVLGAQTLARVL